MEGLIGALRELGVELEVIGPGAATPTGRARRGGALTALRRRMPRWLHELAEIVFNVLEYFAVARAIRRVAPDFVYQRANLHLLSSNWAARRARVPLVTEVNAPFAHERHQQVGLAFPGLARWLEHTSWRSADAVVVVTQVLGQFVRDAGVPANRIHVMPNGVDESLRRFDVTASAVRSELGVDRCTVIGFTGYVRAWHGLDDVVRLLADPACSEWFLLVVGDGPARKELEALASSSGVAERVRFTGVLPRAEIPRYVSAFDVALQPAANPYASPLKLMEYMALGRAIVAPDQPNIREILEDGSDALLFPPGDLAALAQRLRRLAEDPPLRDRLGRGARDAVDRLDLTWRRNAERVLELVRQIRAARGATAERVEKHECPTSLT
jgi:glycosyltransferase involved in cell wall biosynthesis